MTCLYNSTSSRQGNELPMVCRLFDLPFDMVYRMSATHRCWQIRKMQCGLLPLRRQGPGREARLPLCCSGLALASFVLPSGHAACNDAPACVAAADCCCCCCQCCWQPSLLAACTMGIHLQVPMWRHQQYHEPFAALALGGAVGPADELLWLLRWPWRVNGEQPYGCSTSQEVVGSIPYIEFSRSLG